MPRPLVTTIVDHFCVGFGTLTQQILAEYDTRTDEALSRLVPPSHRGRARTARSALRNPLRP